MRGDSERVARQRRDHEPVEPAEVEVAGPRVDIRRDRGLVQAHMSRGDIGVSGQHVRAVRDADPAPVDDRGPGRGIAADSRA
ncbi:MAG: hypothetical protein ACRDNZ_20835 [Streptosporangiaceae bacterium]